MYPGVKHIVSILQFFHVFVLLFKAFQSFEYISYDQFDNTYFLIYCYISN